MTMDEMEICNDYKSAADKVAQRVILSQLNACDIGKIDDILQRNGLLEIKDPPKRRGASIRKIKDETARSLVQQGKTDQEIAAHFHCCRDTVVRWREENGFQRNVPKPVLREKAIKKAAEIAQCVKLTAITDETEEANGSRSGTTVQIYFPNGIVPCEVRILGKEPKK